MIHSLLLPLLAYLFTPPVIRNNPFNGAGGGGSVNSTGGNTARVVNANNPASAPNWTHTLILAATGIPQVFPGYMVPAGSTVRVRANNATTAGNAQVIRWGLYPAQLSANGGTPMAPLDDQPCLVRNTAQIWVAGTAGDGLVCSVSGLTT